MMKDYDMIIIGSGIAGLYTALKGSEFKKKVKIITKTSLQECNTKYAQGGIAAAIDPMDNFENHVEDTIKAGAGLCDKDAVDILITNAVDRIVDLINYGVMFDTVNGVITLGREGAHSFSRVLHAGGDSTGAIIEQTLSKKIKDYDIDVSENTYVGEIIVDNNKAVGIKTYNKTNGKKEEFYGSAIVLATGGAGELFYYNTTPEVATGDGVSLAWNAGAVIADMEFFQFHPTALKHPKVPPFLISEAVRGEGAILRNSKMEAFMKNYHPMAELAPRDIVSRAIVTEISKSDEDHVYLDLTHIPPERVISRFPTIYRTCKSIGIDISKDLIPVAPAAHFMIGGVKTNTWGETTLENLYACGEVASTGVHGANRLASNSLLEGLVFGKRIAERTMLGYKWSKQKYDYADVSKIKNIEKNVKEDNGYSVEGLQKLMWKNVGIVRDGNMLEVAIKKIYSWKLANDKVNDKIYTELYHMLNVSYLMAISAYLRTESRGSHYRTDYPETKEEWTGRHTYLVKGE
ncbi:MAG: L-aspartate oxidase [Thermoplasmata archaeon]